MDPKNSAGTSFSSFTPGVVGLKTVWSSNAAADVSNLTAIVEIDFRNVLNGNQKTLSLNLGRDVLSSSIAGRQWRFRRARVLHGLVSRCAYYILCEPYSGRGDAHRHRLSFWFKLLFPFSLFIFAQTVFLWLLLIPEECKILSLMVLPIYCNNLI